MRAGSAGLAEVCSVCQALDSGMRCAGLSLPILLQEASLLASLRHPNVVNFMGVCHEPPCIVTEFCSRGSLTSVLMAAKRDEQAAAELTWPRRLAMVSGACMQACCQWRWRNCVHAA